MFIQGLLFSKLSPPRARLESLLILQDFSGVKSKTRIWQKSAYCVISQLKFFKCGDSACNQLVFLRALVYLYIVKFNLDVVDQMQWSMTRKKCCIQICFSANAKWILNINPIKKQTYFFSWQYSFNDFGFHHAFKRRVLLIFDDTKCHFLILNVTYFWERQTHAYQSRI